MKGENEMKANELRIGNFVKANCGGVSIGVSIICEVVKIIYNEITVKGISPQMGFDCRMDDDKCEYIISGDPEKYASKENGFEPISLTEEWLLRFGFDKVLPRNDKMYYRLKDDFVIEENNVFLLGDDAFEMLKLRRKIKYVHQLQNLYFALTGEELTIDKEETK
jgi:hypothetical protein